MVTTFNFLYPGCRGCHHGKDLQPHASGMVPPMPLEFDHTTQISLIHSFFHNTYPHHLKLQGKKKPNEGRTTQRHWFWCLEQSSFRKGLPVPLAIQGN